MVDAGRRRRDRAARTRPKRALFAGVVALEGSISGEHGIGFAKAPYLPLELSADEIALMKRVKPAFDPERHPEPREDLSVAMPVVAIIGASADRNKFGNKALRAFRAQGYTVVPINPGVNTVEGERAYASVLDYEGPIDEASFYVPPDVGMRVIEEVAEGDSGRVAESRRRWTGDHRACEGARHRAARGLFDSRDWRVTRSILTSLTSSALCAPVPRERVILFPSIHERALI